MTYDQAAKSWKLQGEPKIIKARSGLPLVFVQRSAMRGRPWLRFGLSLDACGCCYLWRSPTAYPTQREAIAG